MKVIDNGNSPRGVDWKGRCKTCDAIAVARFEEMTNVVGKGNKVASVQPCPVCESGIMKFKPKIDKTCRHKYVEQRRGLLGLFGMTIPVCRKCGHIEMVYYD